MIIIKENGLRKLIAENPDNAILSIKDNGVYVSGLYVALSINEENMHQYFREITPEEVKEINEQCTNSETEA